MIGTDLEFGFIKHCFSQPQLWAVNFKPVDPLAQMTINAIGSYKKEFYKYPTYETFLEYSREGFTEAEFSLVHKLLNTPVAEEYIAKRVLSYVEEQRFNKGLSEAAEYLESGKLKEAKSAVIQGMEMFYHLPVNYKEPSKATEVDGFITTGYPILDTALGGDLGYGAHRGNLLLFIAPRSTGKSLAKMNIGANIVARGGDVLHISLEDTEAQVRHRYDKAFSAKGSAPIGELFIQEYPAGEATVADFDALVSAYPSDLVIVDYLNEVGISESAGNLSKDLGNIARGLKAMAKRHNCLVATSQQGQRSKKFSEELTTADDGYWSAEPSQVTDVAITLNQTRDDKDMGILNLLLDKNRNGPDNILITNDVDYSAMCLTEREV